MLAHRKRLAAQGLSCARYHGHDLPEEWWRAKKFAALKEDLPEFLYALLGAVQVIALLVKIAADVASLDQFKPQLRGPTADGPSGP